MNHEIPTPVAIASNESDEWSLEMGNEYNLSDGSSMDLDSALLIEQTRNAFLEDEMRKMIDERDCIMRALQVRRHTEGTSCKTALDAIEKALIEMSLDNLSLKHSSEQREDLLKFRIAQLKTANRIATNSLNELEDHANTFYEQGQALRAEVALLQKQKCADHSEIAMLRAKLAYAEEQLKFYGNPQAFEIVYRGKERSTEDK
ncbi:hypothetical protein NX059_007372 [Plenodomus lindquistii]|nr:hypothetical protein NX059_007372 [Plenodomus lindquistii]